MRPLSEKIAGMSVCSRTPIEVEVDGFVSPLKVIVDKLTYAFSLSVHTKGSTGFLDRGRILAVVDGDSLLMILSGDHPNFGIVAGGGGISIVVEACGDGGWKGTGFRLICLTVPSPKSQSCVSKDWRTLQL